MTERNAPHRQPSAAARPVPRLSRPRVTASTPEPPDAANPNVGPAMPCGPACGGWPKGGRRCKPTPVRWRSPKTQPECELWPSSSLPALAAWTEPPKFGPVTLLQPPRARQPPCGLWPRSSALPQPARRQHRQQVQKHRIRAVAQTEFPPSRLTPSVLDPEDMPAVQLRPTAGEIGRPLRRPQEVTQQPARRRNSSRSSSRPRFRCTTSRLKPRQVERPQRRRLDEVRSPGAWVLVDHRSAEPAFGDVALRRLTSAGNPG